METGQTRQSARVGDTGPIARPRVHVSEWLVGIGGLLLLAGLLMPWSGGGNAFEDPSVLKLMAGLAGLAAVAVPIVVAASAKTDLPVVWETFLSTFMLLLVILLAIRLAWPPEEGLDGGFFTVAAGSLVITVAGWVSVSREY